MPKGRGANLSRSAHPHSRGSQAGNLNKDSMRILSNRATKYAPVNIEGVTAETATFFERLRTRYRRRQR